MIGLLRNTLPARILRRLNWKRHRYWVVVLAAALWLAFFDRYNLRSQLKMSQLLGKLEADRDRYVADIEEARRQSEELSTDPGTLERIARERYLMKRSDEDLFIVVDPSKPKADQP